MLGDQNFQIFSHRSAPHLRRAFSTAPIVSPNHVTSIFTAHTLPTSLNVNVNLGIHATWHLSILAPDATYREHPFLSTHPPHARPAPSFISSNRAASIFIAHTLPTSLRVNLTFEVKAMDSDGADSCIQRESVIVDQRVSMNISDKAPGLRPLPPRLRR